MLRLTTFTICMALTVGANAQTAGSSSTSGSSANTTSHQANAQDITFNAAPTPTATSVHYTGADREAPTVVMGGYSSGFSTDNCMNTAQIGASGPGVSFSAGKGMPDKNCQILRRVDAHGRTANGYIALGNRDKAAYQLMLAAIDLCIADGYSQADCVDKSK